jgi:hypothetical protein
LEEEFEDPLAFLEGEEGGREACWLGGGVVPDGVAADQDDGGKVLKCLDVPLGVGGELGDSVREKGEDEGEGLG